MTTPRHGGNAPKRQADWSAAAWAWEPTPDSSRLRRLARRAQRARRLSQVRTEIEIAALRHPSRSELPADPTASPG